MISLLLGTHNKQVIATISYNLIAFFFGIFTGLYYYLIFGEYIAVVNSF